MKKINLFCLPFAGGSKYSYAEFMKRAPANLNIISVEPPGRGLRLKEMLFTRIDDMVEDIYGQILPMLHEPYAIYGHSMGTLLGYLLTKKILNDNYLAPSDLFFSGRGGPSVKDKDGLKYTLPKPAFIDKLKELGGSTDEVLADEALMDFFEPIIRADFQAVETYVHKESIPFEIPITVMVGISEKTTYEDAMAWQKETIKPISIRQFPGQHFFIYDFIDEILKIITHKLFKDAQRLDVFKA